MPVSKSVLYCIAVAVVFGGGALGGYCGGLETQAQSLRLAIEDITHTYGVDYPDGDAFLAELERIERRLVVGKRGDEASAGADLQCLKRRALLENPVLNFDRLLLVKRGEENLGLPMNWESNSSLPSTGFDNEIAVLSLSDLARAPKVIYRPENGEFVGDVDLHFDADRMLFSMPAENGRWQVFEMRVDGTELRQLPLIQESDVDNYDACYLPGGDLLFTSTAPFVGVPCVTGSSHVSNLYRLDVETGTIRRLTFEQDHDWCPTVLNNGRVLYLRWEYSDIPHFVSRILFHMNPDGTEQMEFYGSNSYWPNSMFYARPIPNHPTQFVAVISGHHDVPRMGELILFDPSKGRHEADGVVQRIPGRGRKVEPVIRDGLVKESWPKFLHPWPLSESYFITACKPDAESLWGIYLVDVFDNALLLKESEGYALLEPIPFRKTDGPPTIPSKVDPSRNDAVVYMADVYAGDGLKGIPRGTVKKLRLHSYHFSYHGMGGQVNRVGLDGPWDIKRIMGTVPVEEDGSALFRVPANTPISVQPLDGEGKALQLMRSWMTAMPGEVLSCVGCHERQNVGPPSKQTRAAQRQPSEIAPWYGPTRGFSFKREVQPVLDEYCVGCHDGRQHDDAQPRPDFIARPAVHPQAGADVYNNGTQFTPSYLALRRYVRSPSIESDIHLLPPGEFHADTSPLIQLLRDGHHGVEVDAEAWDRLITWIDLNTPAHGTWHEIVGWEKVEHQRNRRRAMERRYANIDEDPEAVHQVPNVAFRSPKGNARTKSHGEAIGRSEPRTGTFDVSSDREKSANGSRSVDLGEGSELTLQLIPAAAPFWIGEVEVTNEQFARYDPAHDSRLENGDFLQFSVQERGYPVNAACQPVVRVSWNQAVGFCRWLTETTGETFTLPSEAQWEYACRAGTETPFWYGGAEADFTSFANLADATLHQVDTFDWGLPSGAIPNWRPAATGHDDGHRVSAPVGLYRPNPWGLYDMHGNVAEWTRPSVQSETTPESLAREGKKVARGGSWYDRPERAQSSSRVAYEPYQPVFNIGFRVVCEAKPAKVSASIHAGE